MPCEEPEGGQKDKEKGKVGLNTDRQSDEHKDTYYRQTDMHMYIQIDKHTYLKQCESRMVLQHG